MHKRTSGYCFSVKICMQTKTACFTIFPQRQNCSFWRTCFSKVRESATRGLFVRNLPYIGVWFKVKLKLGQRFLKFLTVRCFWAKVQYLNFSAFYKWADFFFKMDSFAANYPRKTQDDCIPSLAQVDHRGIHFKYTYIVRVTQGEGHVSEMRSISTTKSSRIRYTCSKEWLHFVFRSSVLLSRV